MSSPATATRQRRSRGGIQLPRCDGRTRAARRHRTLIESFESELGGRLGETERGLIAQAASLQIRIEQLQCAIVEGQDVSADEVIRLSSEHRRLLTSLRAKATKRNASQPIGALGAYLSANYQPVTDEPEGSSEP